MEIVRPTTPEDWAYRYQAMIVRYWEADSFIHRCRLAVRSLQVAFSGAEEPPVPEEPRPEYIAPPRPPQHEQAALTSAMRFLDVE